MAFADALLRSPGAAFNGLLSSSTIHFTATVTAATTTAAATLNTGAVRHLSATVAAETTTGGGGSALIDSLSQPVNGTGFDCDADGSIVASHTREAGYNVQYDIRYVTWDSTVTITITNLGEVGVIYNDGSAHWVEWTGAILTDGVSYDFDIVYSGQNISVSVDDVEVVNCDVNFNLTTAGGCVYHTLVTNDIELSSYSAGGGGATLTISDHLAATSAAATTTAAAALGVVRHLLATSAAVTTTATPALGVVRHLTATVATSTLTADSPLTVVGAAHFVATAAAVTTTSDATMATVRHLVTTVAVETTTAAGTLGVTRHLTSTSTAATTTADASLTIAGGVVHFAATIVAITTTASPVAKITRHLGIDAWLVIDTLSQPVHGASLDCPADGKIILEYTPEITANKQVAVNFRFVDWDDTVTVDTGWSTGGIWLKYNDGSWHDVQNVTGILTDGVPTVIEITYDGTSVIVVVDGTERINNTVNYNLSVANGSVSHNLATNDIELESSEYFDSLAAKTATASAELTVPKTYYMRADGTAANKAAATSDSSASTSMSVAKHDSESFSPLDTIVVSDLGGVYRATLYPKSGSVLGDLTYQKNVGGSPSFNGANLVTGWTNSSGNIWIATLATEPYQVWVDGTFGDRKTSTTLTNDYDWFWDDPTNTLYLYDSAGDPDNRTTPGIEACARNVACYFGDKSYITLDGLTLEKTYSYGINSNGSGHITVKNCTLQWNWLDGCLWSSSGTNQSFSNIIIEDCISRYNAAVGLSFTLSHTQSSNHIVRRNKCYENGRYQYAASYWDYNHQWTGGIKFVGLDCRDCLVELNEVYSNGPTSNIATHGHSAGIWFDYANGSSGHENIIRHNTIYDNAGIALQNECSSYNTYHNNLCYDNAKWVDAGVWSTSIIRCDARAGADSSYNKFYNNTCYGGLYGIFCLSTSQEAGTELNYNEFKNNIIASITNEVLYADTGGDNDGANGTGNVYARNCFGPQATNFIWWDGANYSTYDAWAAATDRTENPDDHIEADPQFKDVSTDKYWIKRTSPCVNAGVDLGATYDDALNRASSWPSSVITVDQDSFGSGWEIGAYISDFAELDATVAAATTTATASLDVVGGVVHFGATVAAATTTATPALGVVRHLSATETVESSTASAACKVARSLGATATAATTTATPILKVVRHLLATETAETTTATASLIIVGVAHFVSTVAAATTTATPVLAVVRHLLATSASATTTATPKLTNDLTVACTAPGQLDVKAIGAPTVWYTTKVSAAAGAVSVAGLTPARVFITPPGIPVTLGTVTVAAVTPVFAMVDWYPKRIESGTGHVTVLGRAASIIAPIIAATLGTVAVTGYTAEIHQGRIDVPATLGTVAVAGHNVNPSIVSTKINVVSSGAVTVDGLHAKGMTSATAKANAGAVAVRGYNVVVGLGKFLAVWATQGDVLVLGHSPSVVAPFVPGFGVVVPTQTSKNYITYYQDWARLFPAPIARRWRQFLMDTFFIATPAVTAGGTGNSIQLTTDVEITEHAIGQAWRFIASATNTGGTILNVNGIGPQTVHYNDQPLKGGEIVAGGSYEVVFDGNAWNLTSSSRDATQLSARTWLSADQELTHNTLEPIVWSQTALYDDDNFFHHGGGGIESIIIPADGRYKVTGMVMFRSDAAIAEFQVLTVLYLNGSMVEASLSNGRVEEGEDDCGVHFEYTDIFQSGDELILYAREWNNMSENAYAQGSSNCRNASWWAIERLR